MDSGEFFIELHVADGGAELSAKVSTPEQLADLRHVVDGLEELLRPRADAAPQG